MKLHEHCVLKKKGQNNGRTSIRNLHVLKENCSTECGDQTSIDDAFFNCLSGNAAWSESEEFELWFSFAFPSAL